MAVAEPIVVAFRDQLVALLPKLRVHAFSLTRDRASADDLVHDTVCNALAAEARFAPDTNFAAWMHRILQNRFISILRKTRPTASIDDVPMELLAVEPGHEHRLALRELDRAMARLPAGQREAVLMVALQGTSYDELAAATGWAVGTAKSRVFRARRQLAAMLHGDNGVRPTRSPQAMPPAGQHPPAE